MPSKRGVGGSVRGTRSGGREKAVLLSRGRLLIPGGLRLPVLLSRSSAGPGAGTASLFLAIGESLVRLEAVREKDGGAGPRPKDALVLECSGAGFRVRRGRRVVADGVRLVPAALHAPRQAFINLQDACRFRCAFCALPRLPRRPGPGLERWAELVEGSLRSGRASAVAITAGVPGSASATCRRMASLVRRLRSSFPEVPIGVEPYTTSARDIRLLKAAGADELKLNIQCATGAIFERVCPGLDREGIWTALGEGVRTFGRGKVCSNLILGLGEADREVLRAAGRLARMGAVANLRPLKISPLNRGPLAGALGRPPRPVSAARLLRLSRAHRELLERTGLDISLFRTMCHTCTACDIEPFRDV